MQPARSLLFSIFLFAMPCFSTIAQVITVLNESNKEPVTNIALYNSDRSTSTITNEHGMANITNFDESDSIFFQHPSYNPVVFLKSDLEKITSVYLSPRLFTIDEFVISSSKYEEMKKEVPNMIEVLSKDEIMLGTAQNSADILTSTGNVTVQKTQGGGGSPIIRGFEANKILLVIDGVRMNNAIYRSGHIQNAISIDNSVLERVEVIFGPTSLIYGSDALGGVVHYYTRDPEPAGKDEKTKTDLQAFTRYSSSNSGKIAHLDFTIGGRKISSLSSISFKDLGDVRMGKKRNSRYGNYGEITHYVKRIDGRDTTLANPDPFLQLNTGYSQLDLLQKFKYSPTKYSDWILNIQYSTSSEIDRLDYLNDFGADGINLEYASYYYGPQNRFFASLKSVIKKDRIIFSNVTSTLAYQKIDEDRYSRKYGRNDLLAQQEDVHVLTFNQDYLKIINSHHKINYGLELTYNRALSTAFYKDITVNSTIPAETRYPGGGTNAGSAAGYTTYKWSPVKKFLLAGGLRYQFGYYHSEFRSKILPHDEITIKNPAITWSLSSIFYPGKGWQVNMLSSSGFRNPNVDDYGKLRAKDGEVSIPNPGLRPEYSYNFEAAILKNFEGVLKFGVTGYYTLLTNAIVRTVYFNNGSEFMEYDGDTYRMITNSNASRAFIRGLSLDLASDFSQNMNFRSTLNLTQGRDLEMDQPMAHIPPVFGRSSFSYLFKNFSGEVFLEYNGWKKISDFSPLGEDNPSEATADGFPSWYTLNLSTGYNVNNFADLQIAVENIFDVFYKTFASGVASPGRNFIFTLRVKI